MSPAAAALGKTSYIELLALITAVAAVITDVDEEGSESIRIRGVRGGVALYI